MEKGVEMGVECTVQMGGVYGSDGGCVQISGCRVVIQADVLVINYVLS